MSCPLTLKTCGCPARVFHLDGAEPLERAVVTGIDGDAAVANQRDVIDDGVEELPIVGDQQQRAGVAPQPGLQPDDRVEVEVVGRLVEKEQLGAGGQGSRERGAHSPSAGQRVQRARFVPRGESESVQDPARLRFRGIAVDGFQVRVGDCQSAGVTVCLGVRKAGAYRGDARIAARHVVDEGDVALPVLPGRRSRP